MKLSIAEEFKLKPIAPDVRLKHHNTVQAIMRKRIKDEKKRTKTLVDKKIEG